MTDERTQDGFIETDPTVTGRQSRKRFLVNVGVMTAAIAGGIAGIVSEGIGGAAASQCCPSPCQANDCTGILGNSTCCYSGAQPYTCTACKDDQGHVLCYVWAVNCPMHDR